MLDIFPNLFQWLWTLTFFQMNRKSIFSNESESLKTLSSIKRGWNSHFESATISKRWLRDLAKLSRAHFTFTDWICVENHLCLSPKSWDSRSLKEVKIRKKRYCTWQYSTMNGKLYKPFKKTTPNEVQDSQHIRKYPTEYYNHKNITKDHIFK